uniref:CCD97-like C-terminal domain-containing protein n=1 Tax=Sinocyclocheilus grahami TaxID=75366 RepID=A0A672NF93_SINGR
FHFWVNYPFNGHQHRKSSKQKTAMWGEIQPCPTPNPSDNCNEPAAQDRCPAAETEVKEAHNTTSSSPNQKEQPSSCLGSVIAAIAASGSPVKSQQLGEPDLTLQEKNEVLMDQYKSKSSVFLERYQAHLKPGHREAFSHLSSDCRFRDGHPAQPTGNGSPLYLSAEGQYFSEEQIRVSEEAMRSGPGGLADLLINSYQERLIQSCLEEEQEREQCAAEESEEEESDEPRQVEWEPNAEEKAMLREEFLSQMHQRFLDGKDDFNYRSNHSACSYTVGLNV